ncbi:MAG: hypothetical protein V5A23_01165 [Halobacteriales archaeon]
MDLDELRAVQNKERQKDSLQHLRESFYVDVADYVAELEERRDRAVEGTDDPFGSPEVRRLTDEIETAREVAEAIYERRLGKLVKRASLAAADMPADEEGLTAEERDLFDDMVGRIEDNKSRVLDVVEGNERDAAGGTDAHDPTAPASVDDATGAGPTDRTDPAPPKEHEASTVQAGADASDPHGGDPAADPRTEPPDTDQQTEDAMGGAAEDTTPGTASDDDHPAGRPGQGDDPQPGADRPSTDGGAVSGAADSNTAGAGETPSTGGIADDTPGVERTTVRMTDDVGEIFGVDDRDYDLVADDVVALPSDNARPLLERDAAERIE